MLNMLKKMYVAVFVLVLFIPFLLAHREDNRVAEDENRYYANVPKLWKEDGGINPEYVQDFEAWINDNARFRSLFREIKVTILYKVFNYLELEDAEVGTNLELYGTNDNEINTMQGRNLLSDQELNDYEENLYQLQSWLGERDIDFYYMQCYHKITVLDEGYPKGLVRYDTEYIGENTENYILQKDRVNMVPLHDTMEAAAKEQNLYFRYTDWCHWNDAGMYLGYKELMEKISEKHPGAKGLAIEDYNLKPVSAYRDVYGFTYPMEETYEIYEIKEKHAKKEQTDLYDRLYTKNWTNYFVNPDREERVLVINDSFVDMGMKHHIAECFNECMTMELTNLLNIGWLVEEYKPDVVVLECVETNIHRVKDMLEELECIKQ